MKNKHLKNFKIYVAGHNGMVGRALVRYLKKEGVISISSNILLLSFGKIS